MKLPQAVIAAITKRTTDYNNRSKACQIGNESHRQLYAVGLHKGAKIALSMSTPDEQAAMSQWVSVEDRMPTIPEEYIVAGKGPVTVLSFDGENWINEMFPEEWCDYSSITHWQALPKPPQP